MRKILFTGIALLPILVNGQVHFNPDSIKFPEDVYNIYVHKIAEDSLSSTFCILIKESVAMHKHNEHSETVVVLEGTGTMILGDENIEIKSGDILFIPKGTWHSVKVTGDIPLKVISVQAPLFDGSDRILYQKN